MSEVWMIRSTFASKDEAISISRTLLEEKLVACANVTEAVTAMYHWEDMLQQEHETAVLYKTSKAKAKLAMARIKELHSYQLPALVAWKAGIVQRDYSAWVESETA